jgi:hypothetical protein
MAFNVQVALPGGEDIEVDGLDDDWPIAFFR